MRETERRERVCVCETESMCVCVGEREMRERQREREREMRERERKRTRMKNEEEIEREGWRERYTDRPADRASRREREGEKERKREIYREREGGRERKRQTERKREGDRTRQRERERERERVSESESERERERERERGSGDGSGDVAKAEVGWAPRCRPSDGPPRPARRALGAGPPGRRASFPAAGSEGRGRQECSPPSLATRPGGGGRRRGGVGPALWWRWAAACGKRGPRMSSNAWERIIGAQIPIRPVIREQGRGRVPVLTPRERTRDLPFILARENAKDDVLPALSISPVWLNGTTDRQSGKSCMARRTSNRGDDPMISVLF